MTFANLFRTVLLSRSIASVRAVQTEPGMDAAQVFIEQVKASLPNPNRNPSEASMQSKATNGACSLRIETSRKNLGSQMQFMLRQWIGKKVH